MSSLSSHKYEPLYGGGDDGEEEGDRPEESMLLTAKDREGSGSGVIGGARGEKEPSGEDEPQTLAEYKLAHPDWYYELPARASVCDYISYPVKRFKSYRKRLCANFGWKFVVLMASAYLGVKGALYGTLTSGMLPFFRSSLGVSGTRLQAFQTVALAPWSMKAFIGLVSDTMPIRGYFKLPYLYFAAIFATLAFYMLTFAPLNESNAELAALLFFFGHLGVVVVDLLVEGKYAEMMVRQPFTGPDCVTWVWGSYMVGKLISSGMVGPMSDAGLVRELFLICIPLAAQVCVPLILGYFPERPLPPPERGIQFKKLAQHKRIFTLAAVMGSAALGMAIMNMFGTKEMILGYAIGASVILNVGAFMVMDRMLAKCTLYMFLAMATYVQVDGAMDYFYTADEQCLPGGPHFNYTFYKTYSSIMQAVFGWIGVLIFQTWMGDWSFRSIFWVPIALRVLASIFDVIIVNRWNVHVGIPDQATYIIGVDMVYEVTYMLEFMAGVILTSKLCPREMEATIYAVLAGFQNFGQNVSRSIGLYLMGALNIQTEPPCNFSNLTYLLIICHMCLPILGVPLSWLLLPTQRLSDDLLGEKHVANTVGKGVGKGEGGQDDHNGVEGLLASAAPLKGGKGGVGLLGGGGKGGAYGSASTDC